MKAIVGILIFILELVAMWMVFEKAGEEGWKSIIPVYNLYVLYKFTWGSGWYFLLLLIPIVNVVIGIVTLVKLAFAFDKGLGFALGLIFLSVIFVPILAFSDAQYIGVSA